MITWAPPTTHLARWTGSRHALNRPAPANNTSFTGYHSNSVEAALLWRCVMAVVLPHGPASGAAGSQVVRSPCAALLDALELPRLMTPAAGFSTPIQTPPPSAPAHYSPPTPRASCSAVSQSSPTTQDPVATNPESPSKISKPPCCRRLTQRFAEELTFRPKLNETSLKLASRLPRSTRPVVTRLSESRKNKEACSKPDHTFSPKLNALSLKLAHERAGRQEEVEARAAELAAARLNEFYSEYTFRPKVSERSMKIAENLGVGFLTRQEMYLQKRQKMVSEGERENVCVDFTTCVRTDRGSIPTDYSSTPSHSPASTTPTQQPPTAAAQWISAAREQGMVQVTDRARSPVH